MVKLVEKHCRQMMELIYKKKMAYFESGGDDDWKNILARSYPRDAPPVEPPVYNKEQVARHPCHLAKDFGISAALVD